MKLFLLLPCFVFSTLLYAQSPNDNLFKFQKKYPGEDEILLKREESTLIDLIDGKFNIKSTTTEESLLLSSTATYSTKDYVHYSDLIQLGNIEAYTLSTENDKYKKVVVHNFKDSKEIDGEAFKDDSKVKTFEYPALSKGAIKHLSYEHLIQDPGLLKIGFFMVGPTTDISKIQLIVNPNVEIEYKLFNTENYQVNFRETVNKKGYKIYEWEIDSILAFDREAGSPSFRYFAPNLVYIIKSYKKNGENIDFINGIEGLHNYYLNYIKDVNVETDSSIQKLAVEITKNDTSKLQKVSSVYKWVQNNIKYIAFEEGYGGFIPRQASLVCKRRYGDCKDMASTINALLKAVDITAHFTWIGTRSIPISYKDIPSASVDNHMIATYIDDGKYYFIDATDSRNPFDLPTTHIQGKDAMIDLGNGKYEIRTVPTVDAEQNKIDDSLYLHIENGTIFGSGRTIYTGYQSNSVLYTLADYTDEKKLNTLKALLAKGNNKFNLTASQEISDRNNLDEPFEITYKFNIPSYISTTENQIFINLNLDKYLINSKLADDRKLPFEINFEHSIDYRYVLEIPENYEIKSLPKNNEFDNPLFSYKIQYHTESNKIFLHQNLSRNFLLIEQDHFEEYNKFIEQLRKSYNEVVVLQKINP